MTELRHLQLVILNIAKDIDELCIRNGIESSTEVLPLVLFVIRDSFLGTMILTYK